MDGNYHDNYYFNYYDDKFGDGYYAYQYYYYAEEGSYDGGYDDVTSENFYDDFNNYAYYYIYYYYAEDGQSEGMNSHVDDEEGDKARVSRGENKENKGGDVEVRDNEEGKEDSYSEDQEGDSYFPYGMGPCPQTCVAIQDSRMGTCDLWVLQNFDCEELEKFFGCDCEGCSRCQMSGVMASPSESSPSSQVSTSDSFLKDILADPVLILAISMISCIILGVGALAKWGLARQAKAEAAVALRNGRDAHYTIAKINALKGARRRAAAAEAALDDEDDEDEEENRLLDRSGIGNVGRDEIAVTDLEMVPFPVRRDNFDDDDDEDDDDDVQLIVT